VLATPPGSTPQRLQDDWLFVLEGDVSGHNLDSIFISDIVKLYADPAQHFYTLTIEQFGEGAFRCSDFFDPSFLTCLTYGPHNIETDPFQRPGNTLFVPLGPGGVDYIGFVADVAAVPEVSSIYLLITALVVLAICRCYHRHLRLLSI
jgi:hypothetical protein